MMDNPAQEKFGGASGRGYITTVGGVRMPQPIPVLVENGKVVAVTVVVEVEDMKAPVVMTFEEV